MSDSNDLDKTDYYIYVLIFFTVYYIHRSLT